MYTFFNFFSNTKSITKITLVAKSASFFVDANTRTNATYNYPDDLKTHKKVIPVSIDCGTGFVQGTFTACGDTYCAILMHNIAQEGERQMSIIFACFD